MLARMTQIECDYCRRLGRRTVVYHPADVDSDLLHSFLIEEGWGYRTVHGAAGVRIELCCPKHALDARAQTVANRSRSATY